MMEGDTDVMTKRPHSPNVPYSVLTEQQIKNIKKDASPFFQVATPERSYESLITKPGGRQYVDRFCNVTSQHLVRGVSGSQPYGWIGEQSLHTPPEEFNTCRGRASARWGPNKAGERTRSHFFGESIERYTNIDMYRRNATNTPGPVVMAYGRPADGYYSQKYPAKTTWFQSSVPLNKSKGLNNIHQKTIAEYQAMRDTEQSARMVRTGQWPEYSEYTDRYLLATSTLPVIPSINDKNLSMKT